MRNRFSVLLAILFIAGAVGAEPPPDVRQKRENLRQDIKEGILGLYDIPLDIYLRLEMFDEVDHIFRSNNDAKSRPLPGKYYSRPYTVNGDIWIFENVVQKGDIHIFDSETLELKRRIQNARFSKYDGGVRMVVDESVLISAGSDTDVDVAVIWDTESNETDFLKLENGHYIGAVAYGNGILYLGSCGGLVNSWDFETLEFTGAYSTSEKENRNWRIFNEKECINAIGIIGKNLVGAGEKSIFVWDLETGRLAETRPKILANSIAVIRGSQIIEFKDDRLAVFNMQTGETRETRAEKHINDLIVTPEKLLADFDGTALIVSLRHNKGLSIYDFDTLQPVRHLEIGGGSLEACRNAIFATDDSNIFRYGILNREIEKYRAYLKKTDPEKLPLAAETYNELIRRFRSFPMALSESGIVARYFQINRLALDHSLKYGKIGPEDESNAFGYKAPYEIRNDSPDCYLVTLSVAWSGNGGDRGRHIEAASFSAQSKSFFVRPNGGKYRDEFQFGRTEPATLIFFPESVEIVAGQYHDDFMKALDSDDASLIDKFLADNRVKAWHGQLKERKSELAEKKKGICFLEALIRP